MLGSPMRLRERCRAGAAAAARVAYLRTGATTLAGGLLPTVINGYGWVLEATGDISNYVHPETDVAGVIASAAQSYENGTEPDPPTGVLSATQPYHNVGPLSVKGQVVGNLVTTVNTLLPDGVTPTMGALQPLVEDILPAFAPPPGLQGETYISGFANGASWRALADYGVPTDVHYWYGSTPARGGIPQVSMIKGSAMFELWKQHVDTAYVLVGGTGKTFAVWAVPYGQGQANVLSTTVGPNTAPLFGQRIVQLASDQDDYCGSKGQLNPVYMPLLQVSHHNADPFADGFADAQVDAAAVNPLILLAGPDYNLPKMSDRVHPTPASTYVKGRYLERVLVKRMRGGRGATYKAFQLLSASFDGTSGVARFQVEVAPIIPATQWSGTRQKGLRVMDKDGDIKLADITPDGSDITFTLERVPDAATARFRIAKDYAPEDWPIPLQGVADFTDSEAETVTIPTLGDVVAIPNYPLSREVPMVPA